MTKNLDKEGLKSIVDNYQLFYVDLWGVVHNGVSLPDNAIATALTPPSCCILFRAFGPNSFSR